MALDRKTGPNIRGPVHSNLARPKRFELLTPWFVAKYSIQLSYGRILNFVYYILARPKRFELLTPWFVAKYSIQLSYGRTKI